MNPGQTLFEYLKRKKQVELKQALSTSFKQNQKQKNNQKSITLNNVNKQHSIQIFKQTKRKSNKSSHKKRNRNQSSQSQKQNNRKAANKSNLSTFRPKNEGKITSRTIAFNPTPNIQRFQSFQFQPEYQNIPKKVSNTRSFISMISPLKNKQHSLSNSKINYTKNSYNQKKKNNLKIQQNYFKRTIKQKIEEIQNQFHEKINFQKEIREKIKHMMTNFTFIINQLEQNQDICQRILGLDKKIRTAKTNIKLMNSFLTNKQIQYYDNQTIQSIYSLLNQNLDSLEGQIKHQNESQTVNEINSLKREYEESLDEITKQKNRLSREITTGTRKMQKLQNQYNSLLKKYNNLQNQLKLLQSKTKINETQNVSLLQDQIKILKEQTKKLSEENSKQQKKIKDSEYRLQEYVRKTRKQYEDKINERQAFLIKQIQVLKNQFSKDIVSLNNLHANREEKLLSQIKKLQNKISDNLICIKKLEQTLQETEQKLISKESLLKQVHKKKQNIQMDMYRLNESLYRHWIALKDVKTLSYRLNIYDKFSSIYRDLSFDEGLFLK